MVRVSQPKVYRQGDPLTCQRIWDVIKQIRLDRKSPTAENILRYYCKSFDISADVMDQQLKFLCHDSLILQKVTAPVKGCNKGVEQIVFCIPVNIKLNVCTVIYLYFTFFCRMNLKLNFLGKMTGTAFTVTNLERSWLAFLALVFFT